MFFSRTTAVVAATLLGFANFAQADWQLTQPSEVTLISTKNTDVAEVFRFSRITGAIDNEGNAKVQLDLTSIDSAIDIRDERMRDILFQTKQFPQAVLSAKVDLATLQSTQQQNLALSLDLHGKHQALDIPVLVIVDKNDNLVVTSLKPALIHAEEFELVQGIQTLRDIAKLERISNTVPVSFALTFKPTQASKR